MSNTALRLVADTVHMTTKERAAYNARQHIADLQAALKEIDKAIGQAKLIPGDAISSASTSYHSLTNILYVLKAPPRPPTEEEKQHNAKLLAEHERRVAEKKKKKSPVQECVDAWVAEKLEEYDLRPELLDDEARENFTFELEETHTEVRKGEVEFTVSDRAKERLIEAGVDFKDDLYEHLVNRCGDDFEIETKYEDSELKDTDYSLI